jgi:hypothetical protein
VGFGWHLGMFHSRKIFEFLEIEFPSVFWFFFLFKVKFKGPRNPKKNFSLLFFRYSAN